MKKSLVSWSLLLACNLMWSLQFTCIKLVQDQVGGYFTVWAPMTLATIFLVPFIMNRTGARKKFGWEEVKIFLPLALFGVFPAQVLMTWGTQFSLASNAAIITLALPVMCALLAYLILKEKMTIARWISFAIAIIGVILCSTGDLKSVDFGTKYALGNLLIFLAVLGNSYYNTGAKKISTRYSEIEMVFFTYVFVITLLVPLVIYYESDIFSKIPHFTVKTWVGLALLTFFHNFLSMVLFFKALKALDATQAALSYYLVTFFGLPIAAIWLGEKLGIWTIIGGMLVLSGTIIITIWEHKSNKAAAAKAANVSENLLNS
jgi:drug/metabolite transporter (DMT)-like permease